MHTHDTTPPAGRSTKHEPLIDRKTLAARWSCSIETIKRREKDGYLHPVHLPGGRLVRYHLGDILKLEEENTLPLSSHS